MISDITMMYYRFLFVNLVNLVNLVFTVEHDKYSVLVKTLMWVIYIFNFLCHGFEENMRSRMKESLVLVPSVLWYNNQPLFQNSYETHDQTKENAWKRIEQIEKKY